MAFGLLDSLLGFCNTAEAHIISMTLYYIHFVSYPLLYVIFNTSLCIVFETMYPEERNGSNVYTTRRTAP